MTDGFGFGFGLWFRHRKIRLTQLWVEFSWVVAIIHSQENKQYYRSREIIEYFNILIGQNRIMELP